MAIDSRLGDFLPGVDYINGSPRFQSLTRAEWRYRIGDMSTHWDVVTGITRVYSATGILVYEIYGDIR